ncbi:MAG: response regulator [Spirochaetota bacterium]|nr:response regulator [Spirochaetota bacterium]
MNNNKVILIVEDEQKNLKLLRDLLQVSGYATLEATNGQKGIELARDEMPDLILMDIQLPILDGIKAIEILKIDKTTQNIPIIVLSAFAMDKDKDRIAKAGSDGYLTKPIDIRELLQIVKKYISE